MRKRNKWISRGLRAAFVFVLLGSICIGIGIAGGGSFDALNFHISIGEQGLEIGESKKNDEIIDLKDMKHLSVDIQMGEIKVEYGEHAQVKLENVGQDEWGMEEEAGKTNITVNKDKNLNLFHFSGFSSTSKITVVLPKNTTLESLTVYADLGNIDMEGIKSKRFEVTANMGNINLDHIYSESLHAENHQGNIDISGTLLNESSVKNNMGNIDVEIDGEMDDYNYDVDCTLGDASVNHKEGNGNSRHSNKKHTITIENDMGNIDLNFTR